MTLEATSSHSHKSYTSSSAMIFQASPDAAANFFLCWMLGTLYMCLFAVYVGMVRKYVLRPGVLFFIRSPDDPNTRLLHEALMRPFRFQISRIALSVLVYMLFILIGFGVVLHGLKGLGSALLPVHVSPWSFVPALTATATAYMKLELLTKYVRQYWFRAFAAAAAQMRLSSFMLGKENPRERGHVCFRSFSAWLKGAKPNYASPRTDFEVKDVFAATTEQAVFVPDGYFVRAPCYDTVSRKYVRHLFNAVTKDDVPLQTEPVTRKHKEPHMDAFDDSEDEITTTNQYSVVYRPPMFGLRTICFILMLWVFSLILICGSVFVANVIGRPFSSQIHRLVISLIARTEYFKELLAREEKWHWLSPQLDLVSIVIGMQTMIVGLWVYDTRIVRRHLGADGQIQFFQMCEEVFKVQRHYVSTISAILLSWVLLLATHGLVTAATKEAVEPYTQELGEFTTTAIFAANSVVLTSYTGAIVYQTTWDQIYRFAAFGPFLAVEDSWDRLWKPLAPMLVTLLPPIIVQPTVNLLLRASIVSEQQLDEHKYLILFSTLLGILSRVGLISYRAVSDYVVKLNAEVKEQHYSEGKTLENAQ